MKCFECPSMAYAGLDEHTYYVRWCDQHNKKCSEVWPKDCPEVKRETLYAEAVEVFRKRYNTGLNEYYVWRVKANEKIDLSESVEYAKRLAGPEPKMEDF